MFVGTGALCAVASFTFFLSISRDWAPCGEFFSREGPCPPHIPVLGADLTPQQTVLWSIVLGVVVGGLLGYFLLWATSRRRGERVVGFVTLGLVTGAAAGAFYGYHQ